MNVEAVVAVFREEGRTLAWPGEALDARPYATRRESGGANGVTAHRLDEAHADAAIREEVAHFAALGRPFEWKAYSFDQPADLVRRLEGAGFDVEDREAIMVYYLADGLAPFSLDADVRRVECVEDLADFRLVAEAAFGKSYAATVGRLETALEEGRRGHDAYVAFVDGLPAAVGRLYTNPRSAFAGLSGGGTRPEFRGRGLYRAVVSARAHDAAALGARHLQVDALPTSEPILSWMGFTRVADTWPCASPPVIKTAGLPAG